MRPMPMEFVTDPDDQGSAIEVDDVDTPKIFGEVVHVEVPIPTPNKGEILLKLDCRLVCILFYNLTNKIIDWFVDLLIQNG
ncbi:hypothetical protein E1A91_D03G066500v1 [Gossypium mustelinum]|uniref:Uncharacterized protein n=2 Tax=Gossypium TaxID=3633 RepID=A0A5D2VKB5_GOSMU|nr:hypothetical protein ES332_D03G068800v1 [Gossypium tomentosum]TYI89582.1 hypothetical protein E1A91_D03G066500v1 [Gossypium mustelinum]